MTLAESMGLGSFLGPQLKHRLQDCNGGSCAIGAVLLAHGIRGILNNDIYNAFCAKYPNLIKNWGNGSCLWDDIVDLNNHCGWTREEIAQWIIDNGYDQEDQTLTPQPDAVAETPKTELAAVSAER